ncbi:hypothetical protein VTL71DRAFT_7982 [Oculimacula yallundae]|uniref:Uncharacterized protein n=1 Tax=Oculimacula yallundae TaxID=86028 RepID=A0ABR4CWA5_9HELO
MSSSKRSKRPKHEDERRKVHSGNSHKSHRPRSAYNEDDASLANQNFSTYDAVATSRTEKSDDSGANEQFGTHAMRGRVKVSGESQPKNQERGWSPVPTRPEKPRPPPAPVPPPPPAPAPAPAPESNYTYEEAESQKSGSSQDPFGSRSLEMLEDKMESMSFDSPPSNYTRATDQDKSLEISLHWKKSKMPAWAGLGSQRQSFISQRFVDDNSLTITRNENVQSYDHDSGIIYDCKWRTSINVEFGNRLEKLRFNVVPGNCPLDFQVILGWSAQDVLHIPQATLGRKPGYAAESVFAVQSSWDPAMDSVSGSHTQHSSATYSYSQIQPDYDSKMNDDQSERSSYNGAGNQEFSLGGYDEQDQDRSLVRDTGFGQTNPVVYSHRGH